ncbi:NAD-dependent epimerase/dehydratase family protein [Thermomonas sp.]|uniref:NAD-dependent epimerase/dehydratase family protein n=1 Tax=Thermomonas sp. TaxID=1971895 RepID=UPI0026073D87|nr:NAD-dependent epimerase/dehydratase family protein [Thermomonas sp.]
MRLAGKRVFLTGGCGFVGGRLAEKLLLEEGVAAVHCLVRDLSKAVWVSRTRADLFVGDVNDAEAVRRAMAGCDIVIHCASGGSSRAELMRTNVDGTRTLLQLAEEAGISRFVHVSSIAVFGANPPTGPLDERHYDDGGRAYPASKIAAERLLRSEVGRGIEDRVIVRPTFVWGPRSQLFTVGPLRAMKEHRFVWVDEGAGSCHAVYVDNLVEALILAAVRPDLDGKAFLVTDEQDMTWRAFFQPLLALLPRQQVGSVSSRNPLVPALCWLRERCSAAVMALSGPGKSFPVRALRRALRETELALARRGFPGLWDLRKFARKGKLDLRESRDILGYRPVKTFDQGVEDVRRWVRWHMADELGLQSAAGLDHPPPHTAADPQAQAGR